MRNARHPCPVQHCHNQRERWAAVCRGCFSRLPGDIRAQFARARELGRADLKASAGIAARDWLNAHPPGAAVARVMGEFREMIDG